MMAHWLILQTGSTLAQIAARRGDFAAWFMTAAGLARHEVEVIRIDRGEALPRLGACSGVLVTGSASMVTEQLDWSERAAAWLAAAVQGNSVPLLGVCYGHQLLAHGLGGEVGWNPRGRQIGTRWLTAEGAAVDDALFRTLPARFRAQTTHQQSVLRAPAGAQVLAHSALDPHQALRFGQRAWGVQFHPEFSAGVMAGYIRGRSQRLREENLDPAVLLRECGPAPQARRLLRHFVGLAQSGRI
jgi:GMP synthase (glutamine-hydrolysing)